jgi:TatD DNase family protein
VIDTHAHLDMCAGPDDAVARAAAAGVTRILTVGTDPRGSRAALELAHRHDGVFAIVGVHPHEAERAEPEWLDEIGDLLDDERAVALGEVGLDYYRDYAPRPAQRRLFEAALDLAADRGVAVVVHSRAADADTADVLAGFPGPVVLHCFSSAHLLPVALERGYYLSFAGNVTYPKAVDLRAAAVSVPDDRILAETDAPYLAPQPVRGRANEPAHVVHTLATLAETRETEPEALERRIEENAAAVFSLP